ncbi:MAG: acyl-CoA thioesterase [Chitinophagaceae bacterium]|nr:MAG: acyl-CoA thioesterase [Chitinophagaceae bacterium]
MSEVKKHKTYIQTRFGDFDMLGHVNNARYLSYMEVARIDFFNVVIGGEVDWKKEGIILAKAEIDFLKPVLINHELYVNTYISRFGTKSFDIEYDFLIEEEEKSQIVAKGKTVMVSFDFTKGQSISVPEWWIKKVNNFQEATN